MKVPVFLFGLLTVLPRPVLAQHPKPLAKAPSRRVIRRTLPPVGTTWVYSDGRGRMSKTKLLSVNQDRTATYALGEGAEEHLQESMDSYLEAPGVHKGRKAILRFPFKVGDVWKDQFTEPGQIRQQSGFSYSYTYEEESYSQVKGREILEVGAGRFETYRIQRDAYWKKSQATSPSDILEDASGDQSLSGFSRTIYWYAPKAGRVVLRAQTQVGSRPPDWIEDATIAFLQNAHVDVVELVSFAVQGRTPTVGVPKFAWRPRMAPYSGFKLYLNDTMQFWFVNDFHQPARPSTQQRP